jgi:TonB-dependent SusC/RagA subfamily outer membrane receptor
MKLLNAKVWKKVLVAFFCFWSVSVAVFSQQVQESFIDSIKSRFLQQAISFPQEKIYAQIDKTFYISGETLWFRAYLADAMSHRPDTTSRYIYVELLNPYNEVVSRIKIRHTDGVYVGHIDLPEDVPGGEYQLRFYTRFMENLNPDYFFRRKIEIGYPESAPYRVEASFEYQNNNQKEIRGKLHFFDMKTGKKLVPENLKIREQNGILKAIEYSRKQSFAYVTIKVDPNQLANTLYLEYDYLGKSQKLFIPMHAKSNDFQTDFFPEGGNLIPDVPNKIAFKALNRDGFGEDVRGFVKNQSGDTVATFKSEHLGMGYFFINPKLNETLYAVCRNFDNVEKTFELPKAVASSASIQTFWQKDHLLVTVAKSQRSDSIQPLYLVVHCRGLLLSILKWDDKKDFISYDKDRLPSGVINILLVNSKLMPISERLVFNLNRSDIANYNITTDKVNYGKRELVKASLNLKDSKNQPIAANLSVSVTDDSDVTPDSCVNVLTSMFLTSDLRGYIENPSYYFKDGDAKTSMHLDMLMMTQGWRRYNIRKVLADTIEEPQIPIEMGQEISGKVKSGILLNKNSANYPVTILSTTNPFFEQTFTDKNGAFMFNHFELPDSACYIIQAQTKKNGNRVDLSLDPENFPPEKGEIYFQKRVDLGKIKDYIVKASQKYTYENGIRMINLDAVTVTAERKKKSNGNSIYSSAFNTVVSADQIVEKNATDIYQLLVGIAGVDVSGNHIRIRNSDNPPLILVDGMDIEEDELGMITVQDVDQIEVAKDPAGTAIFGGKGNNGVVMISTKKGEGLQTHEENTNIKFVTPLGYQITKQFYNPKYETSEQICNSIPDLRSTIYWCPVLKTDVLGKALFEFYTADTPSAYSIIIEGIAPDGKIVRAVGKMRRENK